VDVFFSTNVIVHESLKTKRLFVPLRGDKKIEKNQQKKFESFIEERSIIPIPDIGYWVYRGKRFTSDNGVCVCVCVRGPKKYDNCQVGLPRRETVCESKHTHRP